MFILFLLQAFLALADQSIMDKTYPRDGALCYIGKKRLALLIRGAEKNVEPNDKNMGEHILYNVLGKVRPLPASKPKSETYRFYKGPSKICTDVQGYIINKKYLAVLLLQDNGLAKGKLVIQLFDTNTLMAHDFIDTDYISDHTIAFGNGFAFNVHNERLDTDLGKVKIQGLEYVYQDRDFPVWMSYDLKGFTLQPQLTFEHFPFRQFFKDSAEFFKATAWNQTSKKFINSIIYYAINHEQKKECLFVTEIMRPVTGLEDWKCQSLKNAL